MRRNVIPYPEVRDLIRHGDALLHQPVTLPGRVIAGGGRSPYSHVGRVERDDGQVWSLEFRQWQGPVRRRLSGYVQEYPGLIDVFRPNLARFPEYDPDLAVLEMLDLMDRFKGKYGWRNLGRVGLAYVPGIRCLWGWWVAMLKDNGSLPPHCSDATSRCDIAAGVDAVPLTPNWAATPSDYGRCLLYDDPTGQFGYQFTLGAEVAA